MATHSNFGGWEAALTIAALPLSRRSTRLLLDAGLVELGEIRCLSSVELREAGLDRKARVEVARALLLRKASCPQPAGFESG